LHLNEENRRRREERKQGDKEKDGDLYYGTGGRERESAQADGAFGLVAGKDSCERPGGGRDVT
jgi:hypothetical protein